MPPRQGRLRLRALGRPVTGPAAHLAGLPRRLCVERPARDGAAADDAKAAMDDPAPAHHPIPAKLLWYGTWLAGVSRLADQRRP